MDRRSKRCHGITRAGERCRLPAVDGAFCAHHPLASGLVTKSGFADLEGVTPQTVTGWLKAGIVKETDQGHIHWEEASRAVTKSRHISGTPRRRGERAEVVEAVTGDVECDTTASDQKAGEAKRRYTIAKAKREKARAELAEMELAEKQGRLIDVDNVTDQIVDAMTMLRDRLRIIPNRVASEVSPDVCDTIAEEIDEALRDCADSLRAIGGE